jgi:hypothetical protein
MKLIDKITAAGRAVGSSALLMAMLATPIAMHAQSVTLFGALSNFDVLNDTGQDTHGFEIELDGLMPSQIAGTFDYTRYGMGQRLAIPGGVILRWQSPYDAAAQQFTIATTTPAVFAPTMGHSCVLTQVVGCDHYGVGLVYYSVPPTATSYYWLVADPNNPGQLMRFGGPGVQIPQPTVTVIPPAQAGNPPQVVFQIQVEPPPPPPIPKPVPQYGDARWVKVYKTEIQREVGLGELLDDNLVVPQDPSLIETAWKLLQFNPKSNGNSGILRNQGGVGNGSRSVLRRYEFYKYSGAYDPTDHSAVCVVALCASPGPNEMGDFIGTQNAAANVGIPSITVTKVGSGTVSGAGGKINCGGTCTTLSSQGAVVTLTASAPSNGVFTGWSGACAGIDPTCSLLATDQMSVTASFSAIHNLSVGRSGSGTITGTPAGTDKAINCGSTCSAKFLQGTTITLTATPAPGLNFIGWTNGCVSSTASCTLVINKDTSALATFK